MSEKTEQPTEKKKDDAGRRGQVWRSADLAALLVLGAAGACLAWRFPPVDALRVAIAVSRMGFDVATEAYVRAMGRLFLEGMSWLLLATMLASALPGLILARFRIATEAVRLDFATLDPVAGFKRLFSKRTLKDCAKACAYFLLYGAAAFWFWHRKRYEILSLGSITAGASLRRMGELALYLLCVLLLVSLLVATLDMLLEYRLYLRDLMMTRDEVRREYKDMEGSPEVKQERRRLASELLSNELERSVEQSTFIVANPTHIAVAIYLNPQICDLPFVAAIETEGRALAVIAHARRHGVPVVRNIRLARALFHSCRRHDFVAMELLGDIGDILIWLADVERSERAQYEASDASSADAAPGDASTGASAPDHDAPARDAARSVAGGSKDATIAGGEIPDTDSQRQ